jgi:hypothetical protein
MTNAERAAELEKVRKTNRGILRPEDIVEAARPARSPLHECFEWDDSKAGQEFRLWQARHMIRVCVMLVDGETEPIRAYVSMMGDRAEEGGGYRHMVDVMSDDDSRLRMLAEALNELKGFQRKYRRIRELAPVFEAADKVGVKYALVKQA